MSENSMENLKNNLSTKSLIENIDEILKKDKIKEAIKIRLTSLRDNKMLYKFKFDANCDYISKCYSLAQNKFINNEKVSILSYGLVYLYESLYLYIKKEEEESLNYIKNYQNISPIDFDEYCESDNSKNTIKTESLINGGLNLYGYSFEFNVNYFIRTLTSLISLPNLIINIEGKYPTFKELDIAYYNKQITQKENENISLLRTSLYCKIEKNKIIFKKDENFKFFEESLILGEVKSSFPKRINKNKNKQNDKKPSLEEIIENLFIKLDYFYDLYKEINFIEISKIKNIQLIFFYDNIQLKKIKENTIQIRIEAYKSKFKNKQNIPIYLFIVYTLPSISNISIYDLNKDLKLLKEKDNIRENDIRNLVAEVKNLADKNKERDEEINNLRSEIQKMKLRHNPEAESKSSNVIDDKNNNNIKENKKQDIDEFFGLFNSDKNETQNFSFYNNISNINSVNNNNTNFNNSNSNENLNNDVFNFIDNIISKNNINNENLNNNVYNIIDNFNSDNTNNINNINNINIISNNSINENKNNDLIIFDDNINLNNNSINNNINYNN